MSYDFGVRLFLFTPGYSSLYVVLVADRLGCRAIIVQKTLDLKCHVSGNKSLANVGSAVGYVKAGDLRITISTPLSLPEHLAISVFLLFLVLWS